MHKVSFSPEFEKEVIGQLGHKPTGLQTDLAAHLDAVGTGDMPIPYLGKTDAFNRPQSVVDADLHKIHVYDTNCPAFNQIEQQRWNDARSLRQRTSDTYFVYTRDYFDEHHCCFVGVVNPAHLKTNVTKSGFKWFAPLVDAANKFNGM
ncbi:type II toxin-antitoxin system YafO family toxin [Enterovibrio norvegicus]|uniref:type II toxin-antitoxin system YafO family toxin n=1 Tax=Enterovibrio norvegicus TaxID=188144 RepID=UPI0024B1B19D|nr:type II toxin-antitoxin system YafO family toxin [Enterovibrio norvegicus]